MNKAKYKYITVYAERSMYDLNGASKYRISVDLTPGVIISETKLSFTEIEKVIHSKHNNEFFVVLSIDFLYRYKVKANIPIGKCIKEIIVPIMSKYAKVFKYKRGISEHTLGAQLGTRYEAYPKLASAFSVPILDTLA